MSDSKSARAPRHPLKLPLPPLPQASHVTPPRWRSACFSGSSQRLHPCVRPGENFVRMRADSMSDDSRTPNQPSTSPEPTYSRIVLKLSGESFQGSQGFGIDAETVHSIAREVKEVYDLGVQMA